MAMMGTNARRENQAHFPAVVVVLVPLFALFLQALIPLRYPKLDIFELPLLITIYFAVAWRSPMAGTLLGACIGLIQDGLTHRPFGIYGISETLIGFLAASIGLKIDVENQVTRLVMNFSFTMLLSFLYFSIVRRLLAMNLGWNWMHELLKAAMNALLGLLLFALLDRTRRRV